MAALPSALCFIFALSACSEPAVSVIQGDPDASLDKWLAQDTAELLCRYSRGPFPNWVLWREYEQYLLPDEKDAIQYVSSRLVGQITPARRPKYYAVASFIANNTVCEPLFEDGVTAVQKDATGAMAFSFKQRVPSVPNIPEIGMNELDSEVERYSAYLHALENAWHGEVIDHNFSIVVEPGEDGRYLLRSVVRKSYAEPLKMQVFWKNLDRYMLFDALENLSVICVQNEEKCKELRPFWAAASAYRSQIAGLFERDVEVSDIRMTNVALTDSHSYTALQMTLTNRGKYAFSDIYFMTDENEPQYCVLQSERTQREDKPLVLLPGQTAEAWCALDASTRPWIRPVFWISDANM